MDKIVRFFVSGKIVDEKKAKDVMKLLRSAGHEITFDWTTIGHLRPYDENSDLSRDAAIKECEGVLSADVLIVLAHEKGIGMYVELGIALGAGIPVRVIADQESRTMFFHHPLVKRVKDIEEIVKEFSLT